MSALLYLSTAQRLARRQTSARAKGESDERMPARVVAGVDAGSMRGVMTGLAATFALVASLTLTAPRYWDSQQQALLNAKRIAEANGAAADDELVGARAKRSFSSMLLTTGSGSVSECGALLAEGGGRLKILQNTSVDRRYDVALFRASG